MKQDKTGNKVKKFIIGKYNPGRKEKHTHTIKY